MRNSWLIRSEQWLLSLFAFSTLMSQSAMDFFSGLFVLVLLGLIFWDPKIRTPFKKEIFGLGWEKAILLWLIACMISLLINWSPVPGDLQSWRPLIKLLDFRWLILSSAIAFFLTRYPPQRLVIQGFVLFFSGCCAYAILIFFLGIDLWSPQHVMDLIASGTPRTGGFLSQPIVFAHLYSLWFCPILGLTLLAKSRTLKKATADREQYLNRALLFAAMTLGFLALVLSFTRGAWLALFGASVLMGFLLGLRFGFIVLTVASSSLALAFFFWPSVQQRMEQSLHGGDGERIWIWKANLRMFLDYPWFGVGYGENVTLLPKYFKMVQAPPGLLVSHAHNQYLHILAGTGITGFLFYMGFWLFLIAKSWKAFRLQRQQGPAWKAGLALGFFGSLICFLLGGLTEANFEHSKIRYTLALIAAGIWWLQSTSKDSRNSQIESEMRPF